MRNIWNYTLSYFLFFSGAFETDILDHMLHCTVHKMHETTLPITRGDQGPQQHVSWSSFSSRLVAYTNFHKELRLRCCSVTVLIFIYFFYSNLLLFNMVSMVIWFLGLFKETFKIGIKLKSQLICFKNQLTWFLHGHTFKWRKFSSRLYIFISFV